MKYLSLFLFLLTVGALNGQREALLSDISKQTCECLEKADPEADFEMTMGLCAIQAASTRAKEVKEVLGVDLTDLDQYEQLGELIGVVMVAECPIFLEKMLEEIEAENSEYPDEEWGDEEEVLDTWSDIETASEMSEPEYGGPEGKVFITNDIENTNGSGLSKPFLAGTIKEVNPGLNTEIVIKTKEGYTKTLYLVSSIPNREALKKGAKLVLNYRVTTRYHAGKDETIPIWVITKIEK